MYKKHDTFNETPIFWKVFICMAWNKSGLYRSMSNETIIRILFWIYNLPPRPRHDLSCLEGSIPTTIQKCSLSFLPAPGRTFLPFRKKTFVILVNGKLRKVIWLSFAELAWSSSKKSCISKEPSVFKAVSVDAA